MIKFLRGIFERSKISRNTAPKIISILFALVLWLYVMGEVNPETDTILNDLNVELLNIEELTDAGLVIIGQEDFTVSAKVVGRRNEIYQITRDDIRVTADLRGFQQGINSIPLEISQPVNVTRVEISPQQIKVRLDKIVKNQKNIEISTEGSPEIGYDIGKIITTPSQVLVEGPESKVNSVAMVVGEVEVTGVRENIRTNIPIKAVDNQGNVVSGVDIKTKFVNVFIPVLKVRNVTITPDLAGEIKEGYKITSIDVTPKIVALRGKEEIVNQYNEVLTQTINLDELDQTLITKVNLVLPDDIETPKMTDLPEITINIEPIESKEFTFNASQISVNNLKDVLTTNIGELEDDIKVNISDVRSVLAGITRNDMELVIDATDLNEGSHTVDITVNTDIPIELIEILPNRIQIEVYKKEVENINNETINQNINNTSNTNRENSN